MSADTDVSLPEKAFSGGTLQDAKLLKAPPKTSTSRTTLIVLLFKDNAVGFFITLAFIIKVP